MSETIVVPDNNNNGNGMNSVLPWMFASNGGLSGFGSGNFWGAGIGGFLGSALGNWIGNGNSFGGNGNGAAAALGAQATANSNTELLRAAISSNGEQSRQAIQTISTMLGQDFATVSSQFGAINGILNSMAVQNSTTPLQIVNAIVSGNKDLAAEFANSCCQNKLLVTEQGYQGQMRTMEQTAAMQNGFADVNTNIAATKAAQELSDCKQTYTLTDAANRNTQAILANLDAMTTQALQDKLEASRAENTVLRGEISQGNQNQYIAGIVGQAMAPINAQLAALNREVGDIKCKMPNTISVNYPNVAAVNTTPYMNGGFFGNGGSILF